MEMNNKELYKKINQEILMNVRPIEKKYLSQITEKLDGYAGNIFITYVSLGVFSIDNRIVLKKNVENLPEEKITNDEKQLVLKNSGLFFKMFDEIFSKIFSILRKYNIDEETIKKMISDEINKDKLINLNSINKLRQKLNLSELTIDDIYDEIS